MESGSYEGESLMNCHPDPKQENIPQQEEEFLLGQENTSIFVNIHSPEPL